MKEFRSFYKTVKGNEADKCHYSTRLDTYGCGCSHDCKYCYAKSLLSFRKLWDPAQPAVADIQKIRKTIAKIPKGTVVRLGGMTDCFQPLEKIFRNTYKTIKLLNDAGVEYLIVTKSAIIADPEYIEVLSPELAHVQVTITCTDDDLYKQLDFEKASLPSARIKAVETLYEAGFDVAVRLSPFVPQYIDFDRLNAIKCDKIQVEFLRVNSWIEKWFDIDYSEYIIKQSGYKHLPLSRKKELLEKITGFAEVSVCEDENEAYAFWKEHFNPNPDDCCNLRRLKNGE